MFPQIFGKYVLEREIASGGMATVLLATLRGAVGFEKRLVVKQIRPELASDEAFVRRFIEEAKMTVDLSHPNIVPVYELGVEQGVYYIAMELCEGVTLAEILTETGRLGPSEGAYVGIEICRALDYAHRRAGIVHRDVTPRNVMIDDEGAVRLIDFGIAAPAMLAGTRQESFGSPGHMPPEQIRGGTLTPASDVFAVGALLIEAWTGKPPFRRRTPDECLRALEQPVPSLADTEPRLLPLAELIGDSVALSPEARPESAEVLSRPLRDFVKSSDLGDLARKLGARVREVRKRGRSSRPFLVGDGLDDQTAGETPVSDHGGTDVTQTFAAREEIVEWTRKLPSMPPPKLDAESEPEPDPDETAPTTASQRERKDPARAKYAWGLLAVGLSGVALAGIISAWGEASRGPALTATPTMEVTAAPTPTPTPTPRIPLSPIVESTTPTAPASSMPVQAPASPPKPTPTPRAPANPSATVPSGRALVNLTSSHPASVNVGGRPRGLTPVMGLELPAGSHHVVFTNPVLDERVTTSVTVAAGQTRKVHADFSAATPRVFVH